MKYIKIFLALATSTAVILGTSGCSSELSDQSTSSERKILSYDQIQKEYQDSVKNLEWPQGYIAPNKMEGEEKGGAYQSGYGDSRASLYFECAWEKEWLKTYTTDKGRANNALKQLEKVPQMGYMSPQRADDATRRVFADYLNRAKMGDPSGFQENVEVNCP
ncbi:hypothetical protein BSR29_03085 [Boudabousia liubingyangii]|uniref:Lipoprotein n=2 Tax=Boudabousia TaxID=2767318 RepID=A0A1D9ML22_9ACTO|nr:MULTISPECIES: hypothetical protein [Boudabousia]AOZ73071.1 hypothetical protein BK816_07025 [Boudabousia tangfeifanii]OKL47022.1 hypothetical protein BSR28_06290 [Boudabousia liubingyangii]OKL48854.1 hypothetical protein BSR29_03085 [Boudabousia liubingyangii]